LLNARRESGFRNRARGSSKLKPLAGGNARQTDPARIQAGAAELGYRRRAAMIDRENGTLAGASDHRKDGCALGI